MIPATKNASPPSPGPPGETKKGRGLSSLKANLKGLETKPAPQRENSLGLQVGPGNTLQELKKEQICLKNDVSFILFSGFAPTECYLIYDGLHCTMKHCFEVNLPFSIKMTFYGSSC